MAIGNLYAYSHTVFEADKFLTATHNQFKVVSCRPYTDKNGKLEDGFTLTLKILKDDYDYGFDKNGNSRENNVDENFEVTVLSRKVTPKKGDFIRLEGFDEAHSYVFGFDAILRFRGCELLQIKTK